MKRVLFLLVTCVSLFLACSNRANLNIINNIEDDYIWSERVAKYYNENESNVDFLISEINNSLDESQSVYRKYVYYAFLVGLYSKKNNIDKVMQYYEGLAKNGFDYDIAIIGFANTILGDVFYDMGNFNESCLIYKSTLDKFKNEYKEKTISIGVVASTAANYCQRANIDYNEIKELLEISISNLNDSLPENEITKDAYVSLARLAVKNQDYALINKHHKQFLKLKNLNEQEIPVLEGMIAIAIFDKSNDTELIKNLFNKSISHFSKESDLVVTLKLQEYYTRYCELIDDKQCSKAQIKNLLATLTELELKNTGKFQMYLDKLNGLYK